MAELDIITQLRLNDQDPNGWSKLYVIEKLIMGYGGDNCFIDDNGQVDPELGGIAQVEEDPPPTGNTDTFNIGPLNDQIVFVNSGETFPYMMFSEQKVQTRFGDVSPLNPDHLIAVRRSGAQWQYANDSDGWTTFPLASNDRALATGNTGNDEVTLFEGVNAFDNALRLGYIISNFIVPDLRDNGNGYGFFFQFGTFFEGYV